MSKLNLKNYVNPDPDWESLIGKKINDVNAAVVDKWPYPLKTDARGIDGLRCIQYQSHDKKVILVFDRDDCLLDVFEYGVELDCPLINP